MTMTVCVNTPPLPMQNSNIFLLLLFLKVALIVDQVYTDFNDSYTYMYVYVQGDQIGRIFAYWVIVCFG
jgi:hypothetical protein